MYQSLYILVGGFLTGVLLRSFFVIGGPELAMLLLLTLTVGILSGVRSFHWGLYVSLIFVAVVLGVTRTDLKDASYQEVLYQYPEGFMEGEARVVREPDVRDGYTIVVLAVRTDAGETPLRLRAKVPPFPRLSYGDVVAVAGEVRAPESFETETGRVFDYPGYLKKEGVHYELAFPIIARTERWEGSRVYAGLLALKHAWLASVSRLIPEPGAALAGGLVVGAKESLGEGWLDRFRATGIVHIVVLSGYNLTLIANLIMRLLAPTPRTVRFVLSVLGVSGFALLAGLSATVVRATVMAILVLVAEHTRRPHTAYRVLAIAACVMVVANPFVLVFDTGFQLSFLATIGLITYGPRIASHLTWIPERGGLREIVASTFATQLTVLPLLLYTMGTLSLIAPVVNLLVLPVVPFLMLSSFIAGVVGIVAPLLAVPFAWVAHVVYGYVFMIVAYGARLPFASVDVHGVGVWVVVMLYVFVGVATYAIDRVGTRSISILR